MLYSQRDKRWGQIKLGTCQTTISQSGCLITIFATLFKKRPDEVNKMLLLNGGYEKGCLVLWSVASKLFDFEYLGSGKFLPKYYPVIARVIKGERDHFVLMYDSSDFFDPFFGDKARLIQRYNKILDYRYIRIPEKPKNDMAKDFQIMLSIFKKYLFT